MEKNKIVLTLDAGGTNFVFSAIQNKNKIVSNIIMPANGDNLDMCLGNIIAGFKKVSEMLNEKPSAISFAFPGPADYPNGIIGDLPNLPAFRGGVALGPMLEDKFGLPVFINNDGDLFAYGEAIGGFLPYINNLLEKAGSTKRYKNLLGLTLGTGFGAGIVRDGKLFIGDNSCAAEIWLLRNKLMPNSNIEKHVSIKGIKKIFGELANIPAKMVPEPKDIFEIGIGIKEGNKTAAEETFKIMAEAAGDAIANAFTLIDGLIVIGGGLSGASKLFMPYIINEMNGKFIDYEGKEFPRLTTRIYNLEDKDDLRRFLSGKEKEITVYGSNKKIVYDYESRSGVGISKLGASNAISLGAYAFAIDKLNLDLD